MGATRDFHAHEVAVASPVIDAAKALDAEPVFACPWWSRIGRFSTYLTGKRVFIFGDATHAIAAARDCARPRLGFEVVGLGCYNREFARDMRDAAKLYDLEPLITDDYLEVEAAIEALSPELVLGTQMERHIAKRFRIPCAVISAPVHVQDFPARHSPQMGWEGANVLFDSWVHPLTMGLEEHLLTMFRDDFEFSDSNGSSHLSHGHTPPSRHPSESWDAVTTQSAPVTEIPACAGMTWLRANSRKSRFSCAARRGAIPRRLPPNAVLRRSRATRFMMRRRIMHGSANSQIAPKTRVVIVTLDNHLSGSVERAAAQFAREGSGISIDFHAASDWDRSPASLEKCRADIARGDIIIATMLFLEDHIKAVMPRSKRAARRATHCSG